MIHTSADWEDKVEERSSKLTLRDFFSVFHKNKRDFTNENILFLLLWHVISLLSLLTIKASNFFLFLFLLYHFYSSVILFLGLSSHLHSQSSIFRFIFLLSAACYAVPYSLGPISLLISQHYLIPDISPPQSISTFLHPTFGYLFFPSLPLLASLFSGASLTSFIHLFSSHCIQLLLYMLRSIKHHVSVFPSISMTPPSLFFYLCASHPFFAFLSTIIKGGWWTGRKAVSDWCWRRWKGQRDVQEIPSK